jgi:hypothetical protein
MALQHLRSSTADKRATPAAMADGQLAMNTNLASPGLFFKDTNGDLVKIGPVHIGTTAPNATPASGGQAGNSKGEQWLDTSGTNPVFKIWDGSNWISEAGEFVNASGDTMTGALVMDNQQQVRFREASGNGTNFIALQAPASVASDKTITLPDVTGTVVTTGDTGSVTSTMILDGTILNADVNASAAIAGTKVAPDFGSQNVVTTGTATAASLNPTGSSVPTNGVYLPAANSVAISTNGTGRLFVDANGNVGAGNSSPGSYNASADDLVVGSSGDTGISIVSGTSSQGSIFFADGTTGGAQQAAGYIIYPHSGDYMAFGTTNTERMRLTSAGLLGLGTSSPQTLLNLRAASGNAIIRLENSNTTVGSNESLGAVEWYSNDASAGGTAVAGKINVIDENGFGTAYGMGFYTGYVSGGSYQLEEKLRIDELGRVGIGTTTVSDTLHVNTTSGSTTVRLSSATNASGLQITARGDGTGTQIAAFGTSSDLRFFTTNSGGSTNEAFRVDSSQRLLVGTSSIGTNSGTFVVESSNWDNTSGTTAVFRNTNTVGAGISLVPTTSVVTNGSNGWAVYAGSTSSIIGDGNLGFWAHGTNSSRMTIERGGAIKFPGIATTASAANAFLDSGTSNSLLRSTSSIRYKTDIESIDRHRADAVLRLRPIWYRSKAEADRKDWSWYGLIAEEVAETEPRLVHWTYLEDAYEEFEGKRQLKEDAELVPDGVQYERLTVLLLDVVQRQQKAIETLEAKVAALEAQ